MPKIASVGWEESSSRIRNLLLPLSRSAAPKAAALAPARCSTGAGGLDWGKLAAAHSKGSGNQARSGQKREIAANVRGPVALREEEREAMALMGVLARLVGAKQATPITESYEISC